MSSKLQGPCQSQCKELVVNASKRMEDAEQQDDGCICQRWPMLVMALSFFLVGVTGIIVTYAMLRDKNLEHAHHYGVIIDAGSSHTEITIYRWPSDRKYRGTALVKQMAYATCSGVGISSFKDDPDKAKDVIKICMDSIALKKVSKHNRKHTPVYVGATAGMRLLCARNSTTCDEIIESVREGLKKYDFEKKKDNVRVLTGKEEGIYGWVSVNLMKKKIGRRKDKNDTRTFGALDMGGASAEISFIPKEGTKIPDDYKVSLRLYGKNYTVYTHSFLCYGKKEAERRLLASLVQRSGYSTNVSNPCYPIGFQSNQTAENLWLAPCSLKPDNTIFPLTEKKSYTFTGTSDFKECEKSVMRLFNETKCNFGSCSFDNVYQPEIYGRFMAYSGYGFVAKFFNFSQDDSIGRMIKAGENFCSENWEKVKESHKSTPEKYLHKYCFDAVYVSKILTHGFHFKKESKKVQFVTKINDMDVNWSLGYMVNASNLILEEEPRSRISRDDFLFFTSLSAIVIAFGVILCFCYAIKKCKKTGASYHAVAHVEE
eukprot:Seg2266.4 transcript_id=Seg2266.4/GoldUCD/mRNA.D3Y31 product="Ectonucleoside triphosphate diphosphohydrolase 1" protein_id=Seg2266.4/GoldUCD/D3Y31